MTESLWELGLDVSVKEWNNQGDLVRNENINDEKDMFAYEYLELLKSSNKNNLMKAPDLVNFEKEIVQYLLDYPSSIYFS
jgi:hypothetical protein